MFYIIAKFDSLLLLHEVSFSGLSDVMHGYLGAWSLNGSNFPGQADSAGMQGIATRLAGETGH